MDFQFSKLLADFENTQKQLNGTKSMGKELLKKIHNTLISPQYKNLGIISFDYVDTGYISFIMLGKMFTTKTEISFDENSNLTNGFLNTYFDIDDPDNNLSKSELILSMTFDKIGNINSTYTIDDFSNPYLMNLFSSFKNRISALHKEKNYMICI
jgi:hypothetical protein